MSTNQVLNVQVRGSDSGFQVMMNRINSTLSRTGQGLRGVGAQGGFLTNQLKAIGTTARYSLAGEFVFGVRAAVNNLADFKQQLGVLNGAAARFDSSGNLQGLGSQLDDLGTKAILMSNKFGVSVNEVEQYMQRFTTSFQRGAQSQQEYTAQMNDFVNAHLQLVTILGSRGGDPNKLAGGIASLAKLLPGGDAQIGANSETVSNWLARIVQNSPNLSGEDIANAAGRLSSAKTLSGMTPQQVMATFGLAAQTGGSSAVIIRGMTQLLGQSLMNPRSDRAKTQYERAGLPTDPNALAKLGGETVLERLINYVNPTGQKGKVNLSATYDLFGRQESVRQFVNLLANGGVQGLKDFNKQLEDANSNMYAQKAANIVLNDSILKRASVARQNIGLGLARAIQRPLEGIGLAEIGVSNFVNKHQTATQVIGTGAFGLAAANSLRKMGTFGRFGNNTSKLGRFISGISGVERSVAAGAISAEELSPGGTVLSGAAGDGSRANPLWVIISPLSWSLAPPGAMGGGGGGLPPVITGGIKGGRLLKGAGFVGAVLTTDQILRAAIPGYKHLEDGGPSWHDIGQTLFHGKTTSWKKLTGMGFKQSDILKLKQQLPSGQFAPVLRAIEASKLTGDQLKTIQVSGSAEGTFIVKMVDDKGKVIKVQEEKGIPVKIWGAKGAPTSKGKPKSKKGGT